MFTVVRTLLTFSKDYSSFVPLLSTNLGFRAQYINRIFFKMAQTSSRYSRSSIQRINQRYAETHYVLVVTSSLVLS